MLLVVVLFTQVILDKFLQTKVGIVLQFLSGEGKGDIVDDKLISKNIEAKIWIKQKGRHEKRAFCGKY